MIINLAPSGPGDRYQSTVGGGGKDFAANTRSIIILYGAGFFRPLDADRMADGRAHRELMDRSCGRRFFRQTSVSPLAVCTDTFLEHAAFSQPNLATSRAHSTSPYHSSRVCSRPIPISWYRINASAKRYFFFFFGFGGFDLFFVFIRNGGMQKPDVIRIPSKTRSFSFNARYLHSAATFAYVVITIDTTRIGFIFILARLTNNNVQCRRNDLTMCFYHFRGKL